jgi:hypothetical protein
MTPEPKFGKLELQFESTETEITWLNKFKDRSCTLL